MAGQGRHTFKQSLVQTQAFKICFCNISGYKNLFNLSGQELELLNNCQVIAFAETWLLNEDLVIPSFLNDYKPFCCKAVKTSLTGRASGGILICIHNTLANRVTKLDSNRYWIFLKIEIALISVIVGCIYIPPSCEMESCLDDLDLTVSSITSRFPNHCIILCGDYNAHVGNLNDLEEEFLLNCSLYEKRLVNHTKINRRGKLLVETMESQGFFICNGRSVSDRPGKYTYISSVGKSTIDLVWINEACLPFFGDFKIEVLSELLDHLACITSFLLPSRDATQVRIENSISDNFSYIKWDIEKVEDFKLSLSSCNRIYFNSENNNDLYDNFIQAMYENMLSAGLMRKAHAFGKLASKFKQVWYDSECQDLKRQMRRQYKAFQRKYNTEEEYVTTRNEYRKLVSCKKNNYRLSVIKNLQEVKNSKQFWETVNRLKILSQQTNEIGVHEWSKFYKEHYGQKQIYEIQFFSVAHPLLETDISLEELQFQIQRSKNKKSPGFDQITYEVFKNITPEWEHYLLNLFNCIMHSEKVPKLWSKSKLHLLYKKGDKKDPDNYRGISLLNTMAKLFTGILASRLMLWAESENLIPEEQAGFREGRGCVDQIFTLAALININLRQEGSYIYAAFIDFKKAFDSIKHNLLWEKLFSIGVGGKIIRIMKEIYDKAVMQIKVDRKLSEEIGISSGLLQGESLSPALFILFISDIVKFFQEKGATGIIIDKSNEVIMLLLADDIVLLSNSWHEAQKKLKILEQYCSANSLTLNPTKSKILVFHKSPRMKKLKPLVWHDEILEYTKHYTYLGVPFSSSGKFCKASEHFIQKSSVACAKVKDILRKGKSDIWETKTTLFDAMVSSILMYAAEVWALRYMEPIEVIQSRFIKSLFLWQRNTPNFIVRLETGRYKLKVLLLKRILNWWVKLSNMSEERLPRLCFNRLIEIDKIRTKHEYDFNWVTQVRSIFESLGCREEFLSISRNYLIRRKDDILQKITTHLLSIDINRALNSTSNPTYRHISSFNIGEPEKYLSFKVGFHKVRTVSQLRVCSPVAIKLYLKDATISLKGNDICTFCEHFVEDCMSHLLLHCSKFSEPRKTYLQAFITDPCDIINVENILNITDINKINIIYNYICTISQHLKNSI